MILRDFECEQCHCIHEEIASVEDDFHVCPECGDISHKIITAGRIYLGNDDARWISSVLEVVDKESNALHTREFIKNPNRTNYRAWMKGEGLRPFDPGEKRSKPKDLDLANDPHITHQLMKMKQKRERMEVR